MITRRFVSIAIAAATLAGCDSAPVTQQPARGGPSPAVLSNTPNLPAAPRDIPITKEAWTFEDQQGVLLSTASYRIYTTIKWEQLHTALPIFIESALDHYTTAITALPRPTTPMETYIMGNRPQWARLTQRTMGTDAEVYLRIQRGGFTANGRAVLFAIGPHDTFAISSHECWHQYTQTVFKNPLPIWMEEGLACYMEGFRWDRASEERPRFLPWANTERFDALRRAAHDDELSSLGDLTTEAPQDLMKGDGNRALTFYAQAWALIHFLNEGENGKYRPALARIVNDAAAGRVVVTIQKKLGSRAASIYAMQHRGTELLLTYVNPNFDQLSTEYSTFVARLVRVTARDRIVKGESPLGP